MHSPAIQTLLDVCKETDDALRRFWQNDDTTDLFCIARNEFADLRQRLRAAINAVERPRMLSPLTEVTPGTGAAILGLDERSFSKPHERSIAASTLPFLPPEIPDHDAVLELNGHDPRVLFKLPDGVGTFRVVSNCGTWKGEVVIATGPQEKRWLASVYLDSPKPAEAYARVLRAFLAKRC